CTRSRVRVADLWPVERRALATVHDWSRGDDPPLRITVAEVRVAEPARELVEAPGGVRTIVAGVAAVAVDHLSEGVAPAAEVRPGPVVLCATHDLPRACWIDRDVDELQRAA